MPGTAEHQMAVLQTLDGPDCFEIDYLAERTGLQHRQVSLAATKLITRGYLERREAGCYRLTAAGQEARDRGERLKCGPRRPLTQAVRRPRRVTKRDYLWRALRSCEKATIGDLCELAEIDPKAGYNNALRFVLALESAGFLRRLFIRRPGTALTSNGHLRFQLIRNTGPKTPVVRVRRGEVYDRNTNEVYRVEKRS